MTGTEVSHNSEIPVFEDNLSSSVQADGNGNLSPALSGLEPRGVSHSKMIDRALTLDSCDPIPETVAD